MKSPTTFSSLFHFTVWACTLWFGFWFFFCFVFGFVAVLGFDYAKALLKPRYAACIAFPTSFVRRAGHWEGWSSSFATGKCMLQVTLLLFSCLEIWYITFPGTKVRLIDMDHPPCYLLAEQCGMCPFQWSGISTDCRDLLKRTESSLTVLLGCSFSTLRPICSGPWSPVCPGGLSDP